MRSLLQISLLASTILLATTGIASPDAQQQFVADSKKMIKALATDLKHTMRTAVRSGGFEQAVSACQIQAPLIKQSHNQESDLEIKRTSLKWRNPNNSPDDWERQVLLAFEQKKQAGVSIKQLHHSEVIKTDTGLEYRFMKAIPIKSVCLKCHGDESQIAAPVATALKQQYPLDNATQFKLGDIRGAFSVRKTVER
ncbi:MAG: DUF3365 domain-containing protein [Gammaproteobacteria bacterium]|nr:DUF3365 domain-containing protein [Gammaproteobacteria bacterium]